MHGNWTRFPLLGRGIAWECVNHSNTEIQVMIFFMFPLHTSTINQKNNTKTFTNFNTNYCRDMKLVPINMDYCLLQFDALIFFLGVRLHRGSLPNFNFFNLCQCIPVRVLFFHNALVNYVKMTYIPPTFRSVVSMIRTLWFFSWKDF